MNKNERAILAQAAKNLADTAALLASLAAGEAPKTAPKPAPKPTVSVKVDTEAPAKARKVYKATREAFVKENPWAKGMSCLAINTALIQGTQKAVGNWTVGEGYVRKVVTGSFAV